MMISSRFARTAIGSLVAAGLLASVAAAPASAFSPGGTYRVATNVVLSSYPIYVGPRLPCQNSSYSVTSNCTKSITYTVSNSFTATVTVSGQTVSSAVGFSVSASYGETDSAGTSVPPRSCMIVGFNNKYAKYTFDVYDYHYGPTGQFTYREYKGRGSALRYLSHYAIADGPFAYSYCTNF